MKIRNGFVSNSSSSSFVVGIKGEVTKENLMKYLGFDDKSPIYPIVGVLADVILQYDVISDVESAKKMTEDRYMDELNDKVENMIKSGYSLIFGRFSTEAEDIESAMAYKGFEYESESFYFKNYGR